MLFISMCTHDQLNYFFVDKENKNILEKFLSNHSPQLICLVGQIRRRKKIIHVKYKLRQDAFFYKVDNHHNHFFLDKIHSSGVLTVIAYHNGALDACGFFYVSKKN